MKNIHILPTDKPSRIYMNLGQLFLEQEYSTSKGESLNHNIYITSDEEIKKGDWFLEKAGRQYPIQWNGIEKLNFHCKKIILTDNKDLIKDGVQAIDDEFLEWFVKNPTCEEVKFKDIKDTDGKVVSYRFISALIPKEEQTSCACGSNTSCQCEEPKEKTFEEILSKMTLVNPKHLRMTSNGHGEFPDGYMLTEDGVKYIVKQLKNK